MKTKILVVVLVCIFSVLSHADVTFGSCKLVSENICIKSNAEETKYFSVHSKNYFGRQVVWLLEVSGPSEKYSWHAGQEGASSFYVLPRGASLKDFGFIDTRQSIYAKFSNDSADKSIDEFFKIYEIIEKGHISEKNFNQAFFGLSFWKKILYGFGKFKDAYLSDEGLQLKSIVFGSSIECSNCLHFVFQGAESRWFVSGKTHEDNSIEVIDISRL